MSCPFNEKKYKALLEGLEISEVWLHDIVSGVETMRLDSEYHLKVFESIDRFKRLNSSRFCKFSDYGLSIDCSAFYPGIEQFYGTGNNPLIRVQNIKDGIIDYESCELLPELSSDYKTLKWVQEGDIVITKGGTIGYAGYVTKKALASRDLIFIKSSQIDPNTSKFLYLYFSTDFAFKQLIRSSSQCAQPHLTITLVKDFDILKVTNIFIRLVAQVYDSSLEKLNKSKRLYAEAEDILLSELGLKDWQPNNNLVNIKQLKGSFLTSGRLDAEYYQSKYDDLFSQLSKYECDTIKGIAHIKKSVEPGSEAYRDEGIPFVRVSDVTKFGIYDTSIFLSPNDFNLLELQPKKDSILLSKDGSVGIAYKVEKDMDCITSGALLHLSIFNEEYNPDYLTLVLNSIVVQMQAERDSNGAIIQHWKPSEIEQVIIPKLPKPIQDTISAKIQESFALKAESKRLLEEAKIMVEKEIEKGGE